jgi:hypothetical protein
MRRPLYRQKQKGGTQGIPEGVNVGIFLPHYAASDFQHDFGHAMLNQNMLNSIETVGSRTKFFTLYNNLTGGNPAATAFDVFNAAFPQTLPVSAENPIPVTEDQLLKSGGLDYQNMMDDIVGKNIDAGPYQDMTFGFGGIPRNYSISFAREKHDGVYRSLLSCFWALTEKNTFVIMYDAGVCKTSDIGNIALQAVRQDFDPTAEYTVFFINSSENMSDPAPKIDDRTFRKVPDNVKIYFLKDTSHVQQYTSYDKRQLGDQTADVYSRYTITTTRTGNEPKIRATIEFEDGTMIQMDDMKRESEIEACTLNAVSTYLKNGGTSDTKVMSSFFLKRAGDWCQALCLLDKTRKYTVFDMAGNEQGVTTLQELEDRNAEVMLMTHDRVLLSYALTLGLNVMFTNNRAGGHYMVYMKNADLFRIDDGVGVLAKANEINVQLADALETSKTAVSNFLAKVKPIESIDDLLPLRLNYAKLVSIPKPTIIEQHITDLTALLEVVNAKEAELGGPIAGGVTTIDQFSEEMKVSARELSNALSKVRNILPTVETTIQLVNTAVNSVQYPDIEEETQTVNDFKWLLGNKKPFKQSHRTDDGRTINLEASFTVMASRLVDDAYTLFRHPYFEGNNIFLDIPFPTDDMFGEKLSRTEINTYRSLFDIFKKKFEVRRKTLGQVGGGNDAYYLPQAIYLLTQTQLPLVKQEELPLGPQEEDDYFIVRGSQLINYDSWKYYVVDNYIVTKELKPILLGALHTLQQTANSRALTGESLQYALELPYIHVLILRLLFLMIDEVSNEIETNQSALVDMENELLNERMIIAQSMLSKIDDATNHYINKDIDNCITTIEQVSDLRIETAEAVDIRNIGPDTITNLRAKLMELYSNGIAGGFMRAVYQAERRAQQESGEETQVVVFLDPRTNGELSFPPNQHVTNVSIAGPQWTFTFKDVDPSVPTVYQNIATGVLVPLLPQPTAPIDYSQWGRKGGLRTRRSLYSNVGQTPLVNVDGSSDDAGLRERVGPSITRRVRKSTRSTRRRR